MEEGVVKNAQGDKGVGVNRKKRRNGRERETYDDSSRFVMLKAAEEIDGVVGCWSGSSRFVGGAVDV